MKVQFLNADVAAAYEPVASFDVTISTKDYSGLLSRLTMAGAKRMIATKSQYIRIKEVVAAPPAPPVVEPIVEPVATPTPEPVVETPAPEATPAPEPIVEPIVEPAQQEPPADEAQSEHEEHS